MAGKSCVSVCAHTVPVSCLLSYVIFNPFHFQNCPRLDINSLVTWIWGNELKNYGLSKKGTITTRPEGLIEDISEEKCSLQTNKHTNKNLNFMDLVHPWHNLNRDELHLDISGSVLIKKKNYQALRSKEKGKK